MIFLRLLHAHAGGGVVAVSARADIAADDNGGAAALDCFAHFEQKTDGDAVRVSERTRVVTKFCRPVRIRAPGGALQHNAYFLAECDIGITVKVFEQRLDAGARLQQVEGREMRQLHALMEHERGLESAVREKQGVPQLRQGVSVSAHVGCRRAGMTCTT